MSDYLTLYAWAATIGCVGLTYLWLSARIDRDEARTDLKVEQNVVKAFEGRVTTLQTENIELQREAGRYAAELRAFKSKAPKRGANGKFVAKPKANV